MRAREKDRGRGGGGGSQIKTGSDARPAGRVSAASPRRGAGHSQMIYFATAPLGSDGCDCPTAVATTIPCVFVITVGTIYNHIMRTREKDDCPTAVAAPPSDRPPHPDYDCATATVVPERRPYRHSRCGRTLGPVAVSRAMAPDARSRSRPAL